MDDYEMAARAHRVEAYVRGRLAWVEGQRAELRGTESSHTSVYLDAQEQVLRRVLEILTAEENG